jgi:hypothetical protein
MKSLFIKYPHLIQFLPKKLKSHKKWLWSIIDQNTLAFEYVDESLRQDWDYIFSFFYCTTQYLTIQRRKNNQHRLMKEENRVERAKVRNRIILLEAVKESLKKDYQNCYHLVSYASFERCYEVLDYIPFEFKESLDFWLTVGIATRPDFTFFHHYIKTSTYLSNLDNIYHFSQWDHPTLSDKIPQIIEKERLNQILEEPKCLVRKTKKI